MQFDYLSYDSNEVQNAFIQWAIAWLRQNDFDYFGPIANSRRSYDWIVVDGKLTKQPRPKEYSKNNRLLIKMSQLYKLGFFDYQILSISFSEFVFFLSVHDNYSYSRPKKHPSKFRKKDHIKKKELSDKQLAKKEWRAKKRFGKKKSYSKNYKKFIKKHCNKLHRQMEREAIFRENYEILGDCKRHDIFDPWMID